MKNIIMKNFLPMKASVCNAWSHSKKIVAKLIIITMFYFPKPNCKNKDKSPRKYFVTKKLMPHKSNLLEGLIFQITSKKECGAYSVMQWNWQKLAQSNIKGIRHDDSMRNYEGNCSLFYFSTQMVYGKIHGWLDWNSNSAIYE